jgi:hypothetical protein
MIAFGLPMSRAVILYRRKPGLLRRAVNHW